MFSMTNPVQSGVVIVVLKKSVHPFAFTIDHQTLTDDTVTVRFRDSMNQERIKIDEAHSFLSKQLFTLA